MAELDQHRGQQRIVALALHARRRRHGQQLAKQSDLVATIRGDDVELEHGVSRARALVTLDGAIAHLVPVTRQDERVAPAPFMTRVVPHLAMTLEQEQIAQALDAREVRVDGAEPRVVHESTSGSACVDRDRVGCSWSMASGGRHR